MLNDRLNAARKIASYLHPAEADIESAILQTANLIQAIVEGRRSARVAIDMGQDSLSALAKSMEGLIAARGSIADAHAALAQDRNRAGLRAFGMGDVSECPDNPLSAIDSGQDIAA